MTKISIYQIDDYVTADDKWIGTDVNAYNKTKNFTPRKVAKYFNENEVIDTSNSIRYRYDTIAITDSRKQGTLSFQTEIGATVPIDTITTFILSKDTQGGKDVSNFLNILPTTKVILHKSNDIDIFGLFRIVSVTDYIVDPGFFVVTLEFLHGNGSLEEDKDYIISLIDLQNIVQIPQLIKETFDYESSNSFTLDNVINNVLQVIVNTTSLHPEAYSYTLPSTVTVINDLYAGDVITVVYNYIEEFLEVPDLQRVTDEGSVTTNSITADSFIKSGGISTEYLMADGSINSDILVKKTGDTMLGDLILNEDPSTALGAATKQYVDNISSGINFHFPVVVATDVSLVATYDNGADGVGATLTGPSVGVLMIDGETPAYLDRILVWQQADPIENGIYDLTTVGDSVTVYQLTRSSDADNSPPGEIHYGDYTLVLSGDTNGGFGFICNTPGVINIGVTPISYIQFNSAQAVTAGYGLEELNPNVISIDPLVTQEKITLTTTGSGAATLVSNTLNIPTLPQATTSVSGYLSSTDFTTFTNKENSANKQDSLAADGTGTKFPTVDAVNAGITNSNYWTKTGNDIKNNNTGGVVKVQGGTGLYYDDALQTVVSNGTVGFSVKNGGDLSAQYISCASLSAGFAGVYSSGGLSVVSGGIRFPFVTKTSNYTLGSDYFINCNGTFNITLPAATAINGAMPPGRFYKIKNSGTGVITILTTSSQTIDGALSYTLNPNSFIELTPNITQWLITSEKGETINRLVVETASPYSLTNADSGGIVIFTASTTLTIPTGLADGFECTFVTLAGVTLTVTSTGNTLNNAIGNVLPSQSSFILKRMIAANTFIATGNI